MPGVRPILFLMPDDDDLRLAVFREKYPPPRVVVQAGQFETWEALVPEWTGKGITVRHTLRELLDVLETYFDGEADTG